MFVISNFDLLQHYLVLRVTELEYFKLENIFQHHVKIVNVFILYCTAAYYESLLNQLNLS